MESSDNPASDYAPLSPESRELYEQFCAQVGAVTTTAPPMNFLGLKQSALGWGDRLNLSPGILAKFRQRIASAQNDADLFGVMDHFLRLATTPAQAGTARSTELRAAQGAAGAASTGGGNAETKLARRSGRKGRRAMTMSMSKRAILLVDEGLSNRLIAAELGVSERTVRRNLAVKSARDELKARRAEMRRGHKSKNGDIEAYDDVNEDGERKRFRPR